MNITNAKNKLLSENLERFPIGKETNSGTGKTIVTDYDPETQSVTWKVKKDFDEDEIYDDLTKIIEKLEKVAVNRFHKNPKLTLLIKDLKTTRNRLKRSMK
jgi:Icc-related predicted phosphoesterase